MSQIISKLTTGLIALFLVNSVSAATITFLGEDTTTGASWRTTGVAKASAFDPNGDNVLGNDGYYVGQIALGSENTTTESFVQSNPSYISSITTSGSFFASDNYNDIDDASLVPGASVGDVNGALYYNSGTKFTFELSANSNFILTVVVGANPGKGFPSSVTVLEDGGTATATGNPSTPDSGAQYLFFDVDGQAGDIFDVDIAASSSTGISGIAFETVPEPSSFALLAGFFGLTWVMLRRRA